MKHLINNIIPVSLHDTPKSSEYYSGWLCITFCHFQVSLILKISLHF